MTFYNKNIEAYQIIGKEFYDVFQNSKTYVKASRNPFDQSSRNPSHQNSNLLRIFHYCYKGIVIILNERTYNKNMV